MIIKITLKCPDALDYASEHYADGQLVITDKLILDECGYEMRNFREDKKKEFKEIAGQWFEYDEVVVLEIDTELNTCKVV